MTPTAVPTCRCGTEFAPNGTCRHCDVVRECPDRCPFCTTRDLHCHVCSVRCPTVTAATLHARSCREKEEARERKTP